MPRNAQTRRGAAATARSLTERNIAILAQGRDLLARLTDEEYVAPGPSGLRGGVGPHLRHVLDHYELFLAGCEGQVVDYDVRARETAIERDRNAALSKIGAIVAGLVALAETDVARALLVKVDSGEAGERFEGASSVGRELQFLVSHTVHHYAVIAVLLRVRGVDPGRDFGVAPSTLKHEAGTEACAR
jgi:uncharacterized damage-inducible protein DinB